MQQTERVRVSGYSFWLICLLAVAGCVSVRLAWTPVLDPIPVLLWLTTISLAIIAKNVSSLRQALLAMSQIAFWAGIMILFALGFALSAYGDRDSPLLFFFDSYTVTLPLKFITDNALPQKLSHNDIVVAFIIASLCTLLCGIIAIYLRKAPSWRQHALQWVIALMTATALAAAAYGLWMVIYFPYPHCILGGGWFDANSSMLSCNDPSIMTKSDSIDVTYMHATRVPDAPLMVLGSIGAFALTIASAYVVRATEHITKRAMIMMIALAFLFACQVGAFTGFILAWYVENESYALGFLIALLVAWGASLAMKLVPISAKGSKPSIEAE